MSRKFIATSEKVTVPDYPYGFRLRTTLYDWMEFEPKKGYRHCTQTINPKNGSLNAPKKSTYYTLMLRYYNEEGHIKSVVCDFNGREAINAGTKLLAEHFGMLSENEIPCLYHKVLMMGYVDMKAGITYKGAKEEDVKPLYEKFFDLCKQGIKSKENLFAEMVLDIDAIKAAQDENYEPFTITRHEPVSLMSMIGKG